jgi:hypothetical protein
MYEIDILPKEIRPKDINLRETNEEDLQDPPIWFLERGEIVRSVSAINCTVCGRITPWYELWNTNDGSVVLEVYCPNCRFNDWIESSYGFTISPNFDEFWEEYSEEDSEGEFIQSE